MGICHLNPDKRVLETHNIELKQLLRNQLESLKSYNFAEQILKIIGQIQPRHWMNDGIIEDIYQIRVLSQEKHLDSAKVISSQLMAEENIEEEVRNSCLILQNEAMAESENQLHGDLSSILQYTNANQSFHKNLNKNQSLVAQIDLIYRKQIDQEEYSEALRLFLKWVQFFHEHSYGGFLKPIYQNFCKTVYRESEFSTIVDETSVFVQFLVKVYTEIYRLEKLSQSKHGKLFKNENIYNLIMSFIFKKTKMKSFLRGIIRQEEGQKIKLFSEKLEKFYRKGISFFQIDKKFILIDDRYNHTMSVQETCEQQGQEKSISKALMNSSSIEPGSVVANTNCPEKHCYEKTLKKIAQLSSQKESLTPVSKLKIILSISKSIISEIESFYTKELGEPIENVPNIDPDNLCSVIMYLIVRNNSPEIFEELKIVEYFTTTNTMNSISGYYLNMFMASIDSILTL